MEPGLWGYLLIFLSPYHQELSGSLVQELPLAYPEPGFTRFFLLSRQE